MPSRPRDLMLPMLVAALGGCKDEPGPLPEIYDGQGYLSSETCRECHPAQHATWATTFHRTMTQLATPETVAGPLDGVSLTSAGRRYDLRQEGDELRVEYDDPDWDPDDGGDPPRLDRPIVMLTGSHYEQRYWVASGHGTRLDLLPVAYLMSEGRWVNERDLFLSTAQGERSVREGGWNDNCVRCHATGGQPRTHLDPPATRVGELGIACEACHGPGRDHVDAYRSASPPELGEDPRIVNPRKLPQERSVEVCGQCHVSFAAKDWGDWKRNGPGYRPGGELAVDRHVVRFATEATDPWLEAWFTDNPTRMETKFWTDGTVLPGGREYNGLLESRCYQAGELTCVTCHTGHGFDDPDKLLSGSMRTDQACLQCHDALAGPALADHTHHLETSEGSRCQSCHMPRTTWAMLRAVPSHRIDSPSVATDVEVGRPNACNLCHIDETLAWTAGHLSAWYGIPSVALDDEATEIAAAVRALLRGDAVQRGFAAWALGWPAARDAAGDEWIAPLLAPLLHDPVSVVRLTAYRSLRTLPGFDDFDYAFDGPTEHRVAAAEEVFERWQGANTEVETNAAILMGPAGELDRARLDALLDARNDRPINVGE